MRDGRRDGRDQDTETRNESDARRQDRRKRHKERRRREIEEMRDPRRDGSDSSPRVDYVDPQKLLRQDLKRNPKARRSVSQPKELTFKGRRRREDDDLADG